MTSAPFALAGVERKYERSRPFAIRHLALDVALDFEHKAIEGTTTLSFERAAAAEAELVLDAVGFELRRVELDVGKGFKRTAYQYDGDRIVVPVPLRVKTGKVRVRYRAVPRRGLYFLAPDDFVPDRPLQVWSQCQDEDARHWFVCHDKPHIKMTTELNVTVPAEFTALSNGVLVRKTTARRDKTWTYHFRMDDPLPSYLVTLVVGRFDVVEDRTAKRPKQPNVPVAYYVPVGRGDDAQRTFGETPRMIELFGKLTGVPFPWAGYSQVVVSDFIFGGMENTTVTTLYEHTLIDQRAALDITSNDLIAHELAHHWFGDYVTCRDWSHAWLNEGFATFFEHVEREDRLGRDEYEHGVATDVDDYVSEANARYSRAIVCRDYNEPLDLFDRHLYEKGGLVLHMLRRELGDEIFWLGVKRYLEAHAHGIVETTDLMRALEQASARSLEQFFDQWVYRPGHPKLKVSVSWDHRQLVVSLEQTQKGSDVPVFALPFEVMVGEKSGKNTRHQKWVSSRNDALVIKLAERPLWVGFDPEFRVVGETTLEAPSDMLRNQLEQAPTARLRCAAAEALRRRDETKTIEALGRSLSNEAEAWMVRAECAKSLGHLRGEEGFGWLKSQVSTKHHKVRRAVVGAIGEFRTPAAATLLFAPAKSDASYLVEAEAARSLGKTRQPEALERLVAILDAPSWGEVKRSGVLDGLAALRDPTAVGHVLERTRYGVPSRARRAAVVALPQLEQNRRVREHLENLLDDNDPHLRVTAVHALEALGDVKARGALRQRLDRELDGRVARSLREALRNLSDDGSAERRRVHDELEELRRELTELKRRIGKVEEGKQSTRRTHAKKG